MKRDYHEDHELRRYVWKNYHHALTPRERALYWAATLDLKARHASSDPEHFRQRPGYFFDDDVAAIAETGLAAFQQQCGERLLREYPGQIFVNRCEECHRIVASPIACACVWCGHHWYERRAEMIERAASSIYPKPHDA